MSVIFSEFDANNPLKNGYFRIGFVTLQIPPQDIHTSRVVNNEKLSPLRGMTEMFKKTGQSRWDVTVSWTALINSNDEETAYRQWEDLQNIVAIFKAAPFVEVESFHLRQMLAAKDPAFATQRLSMGLRQLRIDTHPDIVDGISVSLHMTYFNSLPYSVEFAYQGDTGNAVDAYQSSKFRTYIDAWRRTNMDHVMPAHGDPACPSWRAQTPGVLALRWRDYLPVHTGQQPDFGGQPLATAAAIGNTVIPAKTSTRTKGQPLAPEYVALIQKYAGMCGIDPAIAQAQCMQESRGNPNAGSIKGAQGLFQLLPSTGALYGATNLFDPEQNVRAGMMYMQKLKGTFGSYELALAAYNAGPGVVVCYRDGTSATNRATGKIINPGKQVTGGVPPYPETQNYVANIMRNAQTKYGYTGATTSPATSVSTPSSVATNSQANPTPSSTKSNPVSTQDTATEKQFQAVAQQLATDGWSLDHRTDPGGVGVAFFYKENSLRVGPIDVQDESFQDGLWPAQITILFVNNLCQIPLAGYQYPTYQHLGPCSSMVQISFISQGTRDNPRMDEPYHEGLTTLTSMAHSMEQQYQRLRAQFRKVSSVHGMQAVHVENQVLNMLGIFGLMVDAVTTETIRESSDMVSANLTASQYENIFEEIQPYKLNGTASAYQTQIQTMVLDNNTLQSAAPEEKASLTALTTYRSQMDNADENSLIARLLVEAARPSTTLFQYMAGASTFESGSAGSSLTSQLSESLDIEKYPAMKSRFDALQASGSPSTWTIVDYLMFKGIYSQILRGSFVNSVSLIKAIDQTIPQGTRQTMVKDAYRRLFPYFSAVDTGMRTALNQVISSPTFGKTIQSAVSTTDPSLANAQHGAYRDMGLTSQSLNGEDCNPGMYFVNNNADYIDRVRANTQTVLNGTVNGSAALNGGADPNTIVLSTTTSIPGNVDSIMKMVNIPGYNMAEAFPTFKLMFLEDDNSGTYYSFDNFYSYASVLDVEIQRPYNRPATLKIKIMNLSNLLNHKLFDHSMAGKWESTLNKFALDTNSTEAVTGPDIPLQSTAGKGVLGGTPYQLVGTDATEGPRGGDMKNRRVPLQYFPLQTGTKIQFRVGFSNNPDKLTPIFQGEVTEIEGTEILCVTAQSYLLELTNLSGDKMASNSWFHLGALIESGRKALNIFTYSGLVKGPAYGGVTIFGDAGDTGTIISKMLKNSGAKHFGHWQIDSPANSLLKGFGWKELASQAVSGVMGAVGNPTMDAVSSAFANVYDRTDENIMVNQAVKYDGTSSDTKGSRSWWDQGTIIKPFSYYVDSATQLSVWELIQDVARRYPEYLLLEKWYGFPYSCDATLVFGHAFDWYHARPQMLGDQEVMRAADQNGAAYKTWWNSDGKKRFNDLLAQTIDGIPVTGWLGRDAFRNQASTGTAGLAAALQTIVSSGPTITGKFIPGRGDKQRQLQVAADAIQKSYYEYVLTSGGVSLSTDMLKPIRRYHVIDQQSIVHNGIYLNEKIYNCIRIGDGKTDGKSYPVLANQNIPDQYVRTLDVTDRINDPKQNVIDPTIAYPMDNGQSGVIMAYAQSFLREEVGKMYKGELVLRGIPEIEPMDVLLLLDPSTGTLGPIEVDTVTHVMNMETGFITIIKPRAVVAINEAASANFIRMIFQVVGTTLPEVLKLGNLSKYSLGIGAVGAVAGGALVGGVGLGVISGLQAGSAAAVAAAEGTVAVTAATNAAAGVALLSGPVGWVILGICTLAAIGGGVFWFTNSSKGLNPLLICPCTKFGRPWVGGIEGWSINDLIGTINTKTMQFMADEIFPTYDAWKAFHRYPADIMPTPPPLVGGA